MKPSISRACGSQHCWLVAPGRDESLVFRVSTCASPAHACSSETCSAVAGPHVIQKNLSLLRTLGLGAEKLVVKFPINIPSSTVLEDVRRELHIRGGERFALINPGAAWSNKRWPAEQFGRLAAEMAARHGLRSSRALGTR